MHSLEEGTNQQDLSERVSHFEKQTTSSLREQSRNITSLTQQVENLKERIRPYEEYSQQAQAAVKQLTDVQDRLINAKLDQAIPFKTNVRGMEANFQALSGRVKTLEVDSAEHSARAGTLEARMGRMNAMVESVSAKLNGLDTKAGEAIARYENVHETNKILDGPLAQKQLAKKPPAPMQLKDLSANDLATTLVDRLDQGERLDKATAERLRSAVSRGTEIEKSRTEPNASVKQTGRRSLPTNNLESSDEKVPQSNKRKTQTQKWSIHKERKVSSPPVAPAEAEAVNEEGDENEIEPGEEVEQDEIEEPPQLRRTARTPKPTKRIEDYTTWKEAAVRLRKSRTNRP